MSIPQTLRSIIVNNPYRKHHLRINSPIESNSRHRHLRSQLVPESDITENIDLPNRVHQDLGDINSGLDARNPDNPTVSNVVQVYPSQQSYSRSSLSLNNTRTSGNDDAWRPFLPHYSEFEVITLNFTNASATHERTPYPLSNARFRCQWSYHCQHLIGDISPSAIARHLRTHHTIPMTKGVLRLPCTWGGGCGKEMLSSSLGKHIAQCHLRSMMAACSFCGTEFARSDSLRRHVTKSCYYATRGAAQSDSSTQA